MRVLRCLPNFALLGLLALLLAGCFQAAGNPIEPTIANLTATLPLPTSIPATDTPFITALPTQGFMTPDPNLAGTSATPDSLQAATLVPSAVSSQIADSSSIPQTPLILPTGTATNTIPANSTTNALISPTAQIFVTPTVDGLASTTVLLNTPTPFATEGPCTHTVQPGEHLYAIARQYKITYEDLLAANPKFSAHPDQVQVGDVLQIPSCVQPTLAGVPPTNIPAVVSLSAPTLANAAGNPTAVGPGVAPVQATGIAYSVASGDTLGVIAHKFGVTVKQIQDTNGLTSDRLSIGQQLIIPAKQP